MLDVSFAMMLILVATCGVLGEVMITWGDQLSDSAVKLVVFLWTLFTLAIIGVVTSDISITVLH